MAAKALGGLYQVPDGARKGGSGKPGGDIVPCPALPKVLYQHQVAAGAFRLTQQYGPAVGAVQSLPGALFDWYRDSRLGHMLRGGKPLVCGPVLDPVSSAA